MPKGFVIETQSGNSFDPQSGEITSIEITDIAGALSHMCRYAGHSRELYSVAEHSVLVAKIVRVLWPEDAMAQWAGLLHDATEAYVCDLPTQLKILLPEFVRIEDELALKIAEKFEIKWTPEIRARVKQADLIALSTEARLLFKDVSHWETIKAHVPMPELLDLHFPQQPAAARRDFIHEFERLRKELRFTF